MSRIAHSIKKLWETISGEHKTSGLLKHANSASSHSFKELLEGMIIELMKSMEILSHQTEYQWNIHILILKRIKEKFESKNEQQLKKHYNRIQQTSERKGDYEDRSLEIIVS